MIRPKPRVLIIEDDPQFLPMLRLMLAGAGYDVIEATGGRIGLELFAAYRPALVITDILMPDGDGIETIMAIRKQRPEQKILAISGAGPLGKTSLLEIVQHLGAAAVLSKPFGTKAFVAVVRSLVPPD
jgi:DNA-binding response OmpR family regulator